MEAKKKLLLRAVTTLTLYRRLYSLEADKSLLQSWKWYQAGGNATITQASNFLPS